MTLRRDEPYRTPYLPVIPTFFVRLPCGHQRRPIQRCKRKRRPIEFDAGFAGVLLRNSRVVVHTRYIRAAESRVVRGHATWCISLVDQRSMCARYVWPSNMLVEPLHTCLYNSSRSYKRYIRVHSPPSLLWTKTHRTTRSVVKPSSKPKNDVTPCKSLYLLPVLNA